MNILLALIIIAILVLVHEWGHFVIARMIGIPVYEFAIGFGPKLISREKNGVLYSVRIFPLGGFVKMAGEESEDLEAEDGYLKRKPWEKIAVSLAGPLMNFAFAILLFIVLFAGIGMPQAVTEPLIGEVMIGQPAEKAGFQTGDLILAVKGTEVATWAEFTELIATAEPGSDINFTVKRENEIFDLVVTTTENPATGRTMIGVVNQVEYQRQSIWVSVKSGFGYTYVMTAALLGGLLEMISGNVSSGDIAGPVGIVGLIGDTAQDGLLTLLNFMGFLSINLGVINLLPIPALDGGKILFALVEAIRRKPLPIEKEATVNWLGFLFLMGLIVLATYNDILRILSS